MNWFFGYKAVGLGALLLISAAIKTYIFSVGQNSYSLEIGWAMFGVIYMGFGFFTLSKGISAETARETHLRNVIVSATAHVARHNPENGASNDEIVRWINSIRGDLGKELSVVEYEKTAARAKHQNRKMLSDIKNAQNYILIPPDIAQQICNNLEQLRPSVAVGGDGYQELKEIRQMLGIEE